MPVTTVSTEHDTVRIFRLFNHNRLSLVIERCSRLGERGAGVVVTADDFKMAPSPSHLDSTNEPATDTQFVEPAYS